MRAKCACPSPIDIDCPCHANGECFLGEDCDNCGEEFGIGCQAVLCLVCGDPFCKDCAERQVYEGQGEVEWVCYDCMHRPRPDTTTEGVDDVSSDAAGHG